MSERGVLEKPGENFAMRVGIGLLTLFCVLYASLRLLTAVLAPIFTTSTVDISVLFSSSLLVGDSGKISPFALVAHHWGFFLFAFRMGGKFVVHVFCFW